MLPGSGYYKALNCPFYEMGFCERPYCHFKHAKKQEPSTASETKEAAVAVPIAPVTIKKEPEEESTPLAVNDATTAASVLQNSLAQATAAAGPSLELLVQEAVKKVLLGSGADASKLLGGLDTSAILANLNIKKERPEEDDDSDCVIEDEIPAKIVFDKSKVKSEKVEKSLPPEAPVTQTKSKLYLPPENFQAYNPTPIKDLEKRAEEAHLDKPSTSYRPNIPVQKPKTNISPSLIQASFLHSKKSIAIPKARSNKPKFSYTPTKESVLGDVGDLTDSDEEQFQTPDLLGNILKAGNKSGVLTGGVVSDFEERVISERLKLLRKKSDVSDQCDKITSSSPKQDDVEDDGDDRKVEENEVIAPEETEEEKAERKLKEKEREIQKLEEKRLLLENYYKAKLEEKKKRDTLIDGGKTKIDSKKQEKHRHSSRDKNEGKHGDKKSKDSRARHKDKKTRP